MLSVSVMQMYVSAQFLLSVIQFIVFIQLLQALSIPYSHSTWMSVCMCVHIFEVKYLGN